ncbi:hypothetical protein [Streptomyces longwoodensis]|uniref:hypothetical protein n=1 Tax=Streptomyces longwoodensis TaxID=68231 RepID=UPI0033F0F3E6
MAHQTHIAPLDLTPTGHIPAAVALAPALERTDQLAELLAAKPGAACPVYQDCTETGPHDHHCNHSLRVRSDDGEMLLDVGMCAEKPADGRPVVYIRGEDFRDAASVHAATAKLRALLDQVDAMADRVFADYQRARA